MLKAVMIFLFTMSLLCVTLSVAAVMLGAWWHINDAPSSTAYEAAFAMLIAGSITGIAGGAVGIEVGR